MDIYASTPRAVASDSSNKIGEKILGVTSRSYMLHPKTCELNNDHNRAFHRKKKLKDHSLVKYLF